MRGNFFCNIPQIYEAVPYSLKVPKKSVRKVKPYLDATGNPRPKGMPCCTRSEYGYRYYDKVSIIYDLGY